MSVANFKQTSLLCDDVPEIGANFVVPAVKARKISNILWSGKPEEGDFYRFLTKDPLSMLIKNYGSQNVFFLTHKRAYLGKFDIGEVMINFHLKT